jgi:hypothetical protein
MEGISSRNGSGNWDSCAGFCASALACWGFSCSACCGVTALRYGGWATVTSRRNNHVRRSFRVISFVRIRIVSSFRQLGNYSFEADVCLVAVSSTLYSLRSRWNRNNRENSYK